MNTKFNRRTLAAKSLLSVRAKKLSHNSKPTYGLTSLPVVRYLANGVAAVELIRETVKSVSESVSTLMGNKT